MTAIDREPRSPLPRDRVLKRSEMLARTIVDTLADLPPGTQLAPEAEMVRNYQVARNTLRETLRILESLGLITIRQGPGGGPIVAPREPLSMGKVESLFYRLEGITFRDLLDARTSLEATLARAAVERATPAGVERLYASMDESAPATAPHSQWVMSHGRFHTVLVELAESPILAMHAKALHALHEDWGREFNLPAADRAETHAAHRAIADAVRDGHADDAEDLMRKHMSNLETLTAGFFPGLLDQVVGWRG